MPQPMVTATSSQTLLAVHAAKHKDGSLSLMLINRDPKNNATVKVAVNGGKLAGPGMRFDYGKSNPPSDKAIAGTQIEEVGNGFTITVPAFTITDVLIPQAR